MLRAERESCGPRHCHRPEKRRAFATDLKATLATMVGELGGAEPTPDVVFP